ncbi:hypothetical protein Cdeb_02919 [Caldibacillus debilis GB1]|uniref:Uncharacterized protein n=1 Tax=Caldibacillus debilis GB1 TaxID=1339248 RepID=A0A420VJF4_9BACI|nr:hypothetical protein Cdeb_02919 [Caldibacillus debilis GB1]
MLKDLFAKNKKRYATVPAQSARNDVPEGIMTKCPKCKRIMFTKELCGITNFASTAVTIFP